MADRTTDGQTKPAGRPPVRRPEVRGTLTLFLGGDVMTGRGIDQALPCPGDPRLYEPCCRSALDYVGLAEERHGPVPRPLGFGDIWGDALDEFRLAAPDLGLVNLETAVTTCGGYEPDKGIHYRMNPANVGCLTAAGLDGCGLANNHVLDWSRTGLVETLETLHTAGLRTAGAGHDSDEASRPAVWELPYGGRALFFACGCPSAGIPPDWAAGPERPGVWLIDEESEKAVERLAATIREAKRPGDIVVLSIHWGGNWGYHIPENQSRLARTVIDRGGVDVVHGHSSHHVKGIEFYRSRLVLYGCGDLLTDYEGIGGRERYRGDLGLLYFVALDPADGTLVRLDMTPTRMHRFRLTRASPEDADCLCRILNREGRPLGTSVRMSGDGRLKLSWERSTSHM